MNDSDEIEIELMKGSNAFPPKITLIMKLRFPPESSKFLAGKFDFRKIKITKPKQNDESSLSFSAKFEIK